MPAGVYKRRENTLVGKNPNSRNGWKKGQNYPGMLGKKHSEKTKKIISERTKQNPNKYWLGKKRPDIAIKMTSRAVSEGTRQKMSTAKRGTKMPPRTETHLENLRKNNARYWLGKKQSLKTRLRRSDATVGKMPKNNLYPGLYGNIQRGWFDIGGEQMFFRSKWEANYALYLNFLVKQREILSWEFESDCFVFEKIKFGTRSYRPDFKVVKNNSDIEYHEVKGYMDKKSATKIKRMAKYYPHIRLILVEKDAYNSIKNSVGKMLKFYD